MTVAKVQLKKLGITFVKEARGIAEYRLDCNDLKIILCENHASPVVTLMPLYRVGSRNEAVGYTGATHILEHMMFKDVKDGRTGQIYNFPELLKPIGGVWNATTWFDRTNYFEVVPKQYLEQCIAAESDRMRNLLLNDEERSKEMTVVRNELERGQNDPTRVMMLQAYAVAFREHPYHHPTIGWVSDVENITIERLKQFYDEFYWPDNTTVLVMGDFDSAHALELIAKYYGVHPKSSKPLPKVYTVEPPQEGERRFVINRPGDAPRVMMAFHVPEAVHADTYPLAVAADVLGGSRKTSRLYKALVETGLAASANIWHFQQRDPGLFMVMATVAPGAKPEDVEKAISAELERLVKEPPTAEELRRVKAANKKSTALAASDPMQMASQLGEAESVADWTFYIEYDEKFSAVTSAQVAAAIGTYMHADNRTVGYFIPRQPKAAERNGDAGADITTGGADAAKSDFAGKTQKVTLDNGLTLLLMPTPGSDVIGVSGRLTAGAGHAPKEKPLIGSLAANQLTSGSTTRTAEQISSTLEEMGSAVGFSAGMFSTNFNTQVVADDLPGMLALIADLLRNPVYPEKELAVTRMQYQSFFERQMSDTEGMAELALVQNLYAKDSVYYDRSFQECIEEIKAITREELAAFHQAYFSPQGMTLAIVGDFNVEATVAAVKAAFGDWKGPEVKPVEVGSVTMPSARRRVDVEIPGKSNASIVIGHPATLARAHEDLFAARLANAALGGDTIAARLGAEVRRNAGLTYGIYSSFGDVTRGGAPWTIKLSVNPKNVDKALELIEGIVAGYLKDGITEAELNRDASSASGTFVVQLRKYSSIAATLVDYESLGLGLEAMDAYVAKMKAVTKAEVDAAIRKHIRPDSFITVVAGTLKG